MCAVSMIGDMGMHQWPKPFPFPHDSNHSYPGLGEQPNLHFTPFVQPYNGPTKEQFEEFLKLMRAAAAFDKATGQPDCEDPAKYEWMRGLGVYLGVDTNV